MIPELGPYLSTKTVGLEWLGAVPEHWEVRRAKQLMRPVDVRSQTGGEELLTVSSERGVVPRSTASVSMFEAESYVDHKLCWPDDLVINSLWAWARGLGVSSRHGIVSTAYGVYRRRPGFDLVPRFVHYLVRSNPFQWEMQVRSKGVWKSRLQLTDAAFLDAPLPVPPPAEQAAIVRYLDHVDRRISRYIRAKQRLIELLEEEKQVIIHRAVTRGLDPNVRLKPSSVEWLGDVPEHWGVRRSRYVFHEVDQRSTAGPETHLSMSQKLGLVPSSRIEGWRLVAESYVGAKLCEPGDIILNRLKAHLGVFALAREAGLVSADYTVLRPRIEVNSRYFEAVYRTTSCRVELRKRTRGIVEGFWRLYTPDFYEVPVPVPPIAEQLAITLYLDSALGDVDRSVERIRSELTLLSEYRTRLIADVVTGKLDVREAAADLPEADDADLEDIIEIDDVVADEIDAKLEEVAT